MSGDEDIIWPQKYSGQELAKAICGSKFTSLTGAHMAYLLSSEAFQEYVMKFLVSIN